MLQQVILFDGQCKLCSRWVPFVIKRDPNAKFTFCSVQSPKGQELLTSIGLATDTFSTMVLLCNEKAYFKSQAFFKITEQLQLPWPWLNIFTMLPLALRDWFYDKIALNRYQLFGKQNYCMIATKDISERFIE